MLRSLRTCLPLALLLHATAAYSAEALPLESSMSECVGRLQLDLPGRVEVAAYSFKRLESRILGGGGQPRFEFDDGQSAGWSHIDYRSEIFITAALSSDEIGQLENKFVASRLSYEKTLRKLDIPEQRGIKVEPVDTGLSHVKAWRIDSGFRLMMRLNEHVLLTTIRGHGKTLAETRKRVDDLAQSTKYRAVHAIPTERGVCLPYAFIKDDGKLFRKVGMTYRLVAHPDITIYVQDSGAAVYDSKEQERNAKPDHVIESNWLQMAGRTIPMWVLLQNRPTMLAGRLGLASFVKISRKNNCDNLAYMAVVRGDPNAKEDSPDVQLHVLQDQQKAIVKGIAPVNEKTFLNIAQTVSDSLRHRPAK